MSISLCELTLQLQAGNELAYHGFVKRYQARIFRIAHGILGNHGEAEEITQEVFVKVFISIGTFSGRSSLFTWVYRIVVNEAYSALRKRGATVPRLSPNAENPVSDPLDMQPDPRPGCDTVTLQRDYLNRLLKAIPERDRNLLLLREVEGYSITELAEVTRLNQNTIKLRLCRARQRLLSAAASFEQRRTVPAPV
jgi:RNA polymerase sigma-70 factor (ECF subfamily)